MTNQKNPNWLPGLNGLRFIAAMIVLVSHVEEIKSVFGLRSGAEGPLRIYTIAGELAVTFFFVLSGFLITWLMYKEQEESHEISLKNFYLRRFFRIFPLYFLVVIIGLFILPNFNFLYFPGWSEKLGNHFWWKAAMYLSFFPNLAAVTTYPIAYVTHTWSIGVEEQFYLLWPLAIKYHKNNLKMILILIGVYLLLAKGAAMITQYKIVENEAIAIFSRFINLSRFDCMALGALVAFIYHHQMKQILNIIYLPFVQWVSYLLTIIMMIFGTAFGLFTHEIYAILFAIIILNVGTNPNTIVNFNNNTIDWFGQISYGIYMYHFLCIRIVLQVILQFTPANTTFGWAANIALYVLSIVLVLIISTISYRYFELWFLKFKKLFGRTNRII